MGFFTEEIAIDLGTANTLIIHNDKVVINSPSIVAMDRSTKKIIAIGEEAKFMQGKTHENIKTIRPLKDGVIADFEASEKMIPLKRINQSDEIADSIIWLLTSAPDNLTGQVLHLDGGMSQILV